MKYEDARENIKSGDLLAWSHREPWYRSWRDFKIAMVRLFTRSEYSHTATAWCIGDRVLVIEAVMPAVRIYPLSKLGDFFHLPLGAPWSDAALTWALWHVGDPYSQSQAMQAFFELPKSDDLWQCSELTHAIAAIDGVDLGGQITPSGIVNSALLRGATLTYVTGDK